MKNKMHRSNGISQLVLKCTTSEISGSVVFRFFFPIRSEVPNMYRNEWFCAVMSNNIISFFSAALLDVLLSWEARGTMSFHVQLRYILKVVSASAWVMILPICYAYTWENPSGLAKSIKNWVGASGQNQPSLYILAVVIYLSPNILAALLFLFPFIRRRLERSNYKIVALMMWWSQVSLFHAVFKSLRQLP